uniref:THAP domain-containing protein 11 n=1 Tax=Callorhinchus milii TaxID=7868 RepID=A0A4W3JS15_CALMI
MPGFTCCVPGCYNNSYRDRDLRFYTFPKDEEQRKVWLQNISRAGVSGCFSTFKPTTGHRVCSGHFQELEAVEQKDSQLICFPLSIS